MQAAEHYSCSATYSKDHKKVTGQCNKCEGYPPKGLFVPVSFLYLFRTCLFLFTLFVSCIPFVHYIILIFILFFSELQLDPAADQRRKTANDWKPKYPRDLSRGRKAVREEVAEIESGHFSDLRRQQTVWIRSNWLIGQRVSRGNLYLPGI